MPEGPGTHAGTRPAPETAGDVFEYVIRLRLLKAWAGNPSLEQLRLSTGFPRSTLFDALNPRRTGLPALGLVQRFVAACGGSESDVAAWTSAWRRIQAEEAASDPKPARAKRGRRRGQGDSGRADQAPVVPRQLPAGSRHFVGRAAELAALDDLLADGTGAGLPIAVITGTAGVGKTTLAVHWAHQVADRFPDGQLYVDLRGFHPEGRPVGQAEATRGFLAALGVPPERIPPGADDQTALYRSLLADRRILVLLDNAGDAEQVRAMLPGSRGCLVVVTSRTRLTGLIVSQDAVPIRLGLLTETEGHQLLACKVGRERTTAEPEAAAEVVERCARLPLAVAVAAARAAADPGLRLGAIAAELATGREGLGALATGDRGTDPRAVLSWSYRRLSRPAGRLFRLLGACPGPDTGVRAAAGLAGVTPEYARELMEELSEASLVTEQQVGRYGLHDLLRTYAVELLHGNETEAERRAAVRRLLDHYLHTALPAARLLQPIVDPVVPPPAADGVTPEHIADAEQAMDWFGAEHHGLVAAVGQAAANGFDTHAWQLARALATYLDRRGYWGDWVDTQLTALDAARRLGDLPTQGRVQQLLAAAYKRMARYAESAARLRAALDLFGELGDPAEQAGTHLDLSSLFDRQGDHDAALRHALQALAVYRATGNEGGQASALNNAGWHHARLGNLQEALDCCREALALFQRLGRKNGAAVAWDSLGDVHHRLGDHPQAIGAYRQAVDLFGELGNRLHEAETLTRLGDAYQAAGEPDSARDAWRGALVVLDQLGHESAIEVRDRLNRSRTASA